MSQDPMQAHDRPSSAGPSANVQSDQEGYIPPPAAPSAQPGYIPPPEAYHQSGTDLNVPSMNELQAGFQKFSLGRKILLGAGSAAVLFFLFPWYRMYANLFGTTTADTAGGVRGLNMVIWLALIAFVAAMALPLLGKSIKQYLPLTYSDGQIAIAGAGGLTVLTLLSAFLSMPSIDRSLVLGTGVDVGVSFAWGFYLAFLALLAMIGGAWMMYQARE